MQFGYFNYPMPANETVLSYAPGSPEKIALKKALADLKKKTLDIPMYIGGKAVRTGKKVAIHPPHEIKHLLGHFHAGSKQHVDQAINTALKVRIGWSEMSWESRAHIFLKAAEFVSNKISLRNECCDYVGSK